MVDAFPSIEETPAEGERDYNPGIRLFVRRFFADQTVPELLLELLLVATSSKEIGENSLPTDALLPPVGLLRSWPARTPLRYAPKARLNLKLFAFLGASKLDTRHDSHRQHYRDVVRAMTGPDKLSTSGAMDVNEVLKTLENLFQGFQSVGAQR